MFRMTNAVNLFDGEKVNVNFFSEVGDFSGVLSWFVIEDKSDNKIGEFLWNDELIIVRFCGSVPQYVELRRFMEKFGFEEKSITVNNDCNDAAIIFEVK